MSELAKGAGRVDKDVVAACEVRRLEKRQCAAVYDAAWPKLLPTSATAKSASPRGRTC
jgi:hypothetical protein